MTLEEFVAFWLAETPIKPPLDAYERVADFVGTTLYRDDEFQVQLWACPPNSTVTDHTHPDVDGYAVRAAGEIAFRKHGAPVKRQEMKIVKWRGMKTPMIRVYHDECHGVNIGPAGGSFLAITRRLDGKAPQSVHRNWAGAPLDAEHAVALET